MRVGSAIWGNTLNSRNITRVDAIGEVKPVDEVDVGNIEPLINDANFDTRSGILSRNLVDVSAGCVAANGQISVQIPLIGSVGIFRRQTRRVDGCDRIGQRDIVGRNFTCVCAEARFV